MRTLACLAAVFFLVLSLPLSTSGQVSIGVQGGLSLAKLGGEDVEAVIDKLGRQAPDWWDNVPLNCPRTLDLSWPARPTGNWNGQRNVSQCISEFAAVTDADPDKLGIDLLSIVRVFVSRGFMVPVEFE